MTERAVKILDGVEVKTDGEYLVVRSGGRELRKQMNFKKVRFVISADAVRLSMDSDRRRDISYLGTYEAHIVNMMNGVLGLYESRLKIIYSHFPIKFRVEGRKAYIQNFLGEKSPRVMEFSPDVDVKLDKDIVIVTGHDKEKVSQTAANIETACKVTKFDRMVFQDGIFILEKPQLVKGK